MGPRPLDKDTVSGEEGLVAKMTQYETKAPPSFISSYLLGSLCWFIQNKTILSFILNVFLIFLTACERL